MSDSGGNPPMAAIVVGREQTGLGVLRSLRLAGVTVYVACPHDDLVTRSRWYRPIPGPTAWDGTPGPQVEEILRAMPLTEAVLIPARDDAALWVADIPRSGLADRFRVSTSSRATLEILQNKARFGEFLAQTDIPHPRTFSIGCTADIASIPFDELDRVFVKPADSQKFLQVMGVKGIWARSRDEFEQIWQRLEGSGLSVVAQEYVPGDTNDHYFIDGFRDRNGILTGLFARRRLRIWPPDFGSSSYCESIPLEEVAGALAGLSQLLSKLSYRGIFSAEFKRDERDGVFRILEVNTRAWWYVEFATRCGINVCKMAYEDACGLQVTHAPRKYPTGVGCINFRRDIQAVFSRDRKSRPPLRRALRQWSRGHFNVFRLDDPFPGLFVARQALGQAWRWGVRRILGKR